MSSGSDPIQALLAGVSTCVVLARGDDLPRGLLATLESRGIETMVTGLPMLAFAELLRVDTAERRSRSSAGGWGLPSKGGVALLIADRSRWDRLDDLLDAVRLHQSHVAVWMGADRLMLEIAGPSPPATLKLAGHVLDEPTDPKATEPDAPPRRSRSRMEEAVTPEEIDMLLKLFDEPPESESREGPSEPAGGPGPWKGDDS